MRTIPLGKPRQQDAEGCAVMRTVRALVLLLALVLALASCAINAGNGQAGGTGTATANVVDNCGTVATGPRPVQNTPAAVSVEQCFAAAFTRCRPATLRYTIGGIDTITTHALAVVPSAGSGCHIVDTRQTILAGSGNKGPTTVLTCTAATQEASGLLLSGCQNGQDFTVAGTSGPTPTYSPLASV